MLRKSDQLLFGDTLGPAGVYTSQTYLLGGYTAITLLVTAGAAPTGTTPTLLWAMQTSSDGVNFSQVGGALTAMSATLLQQSVDYSTTTAQGAITGPYYRVTATPSAGSVWTNMYADLMAQV